MSDGLPKAETGTRTVLTFAGFHHKRQTRVDAVGSLLRLLWCHRCALLN